MKMNVTDKLTSFYMELIMNDESKPPYHSHYIRQVDAALMILAKRTANVSTITKVFIETNCCKISRKIIWNRIITLKKLLHFIPEIRFVVD